MRTALWLLVAVMVGCLLALRFVPNLQPWLKEAVPVAAPLVDKLSSISDLRDGFEALNKSLREPEALPDDIYRGWGIPPVDQAWGLAEMEACRSALMSHQIRNDGAFPSSASEFGVGMFRQIMATTSRMNRGEIDDQMKLFNAFEGIFETYLKAADDGWRYDKELAVLWSIYAGISEVIQDKAEDSDTRLLRTSVRWRIENGKTTATDFSSTRANVFRNIERALNASTDIEFFRPEARTLLLQRLETVFFGLDSSRQKKLRKLLERLVEEESDPEAGASYQRMLEKARKS
ncbi:MAG: hypothetical protein KDN20_08260 [Verrucomicrobiae bacterium]|nr:hypothetical protein [Verrucomicrobiae bacterium]